MTILRIDETDMQRLTELAQAAYPEEACGLLVGEQGQVLAVWSLRNTAADRRRHFRFDPLEYMQAERRADDAGWRVVGVWHSHPDARPQPSAMDLRDAWPGWSYIIVGTSAGGVTGVRSWRLAGEVFEEEEIQS